MILTARQHRRAFSLRLNRWRALGCQGPAPRPHHRVAGDDVVHTMVLRALSSEMLATVRDARVLVASRPSATTAPGGFWRTNALGDMVTVAPIDDGPPPNVSWR